MGALENDAIGDNNGPSDCDERADNLDELHHALR
jgi:hypothetical protein